MNNLSTSKSLNIVLEGTDAIGKTTLTTYLNEHFPQVKVFDRAKQDISKLMLFTNPPEEIASKIEDNIKRNLQDTHIFFLYTRDFDVLLKRVYAREVISDFDEDTVLYNSLYIIVWNLLKKKMNENFHLLDITDKTIWEISTEILNKLGID